MSTRRVVGYALSLTSALLVGVPSAVTQAQSCPAGLACYYVPPILMAPATAADGYSGDLAFAAPTVAATVTYAFGTQSTTSVTVPAGSSARLSIPTAYGSASAFNVAEYRGAFVTSTARDLLVEQRMTAQYWQSSSTTKPNSVGLGTRFRVAGYSLSQDNGDGSGWDYLAVYAPADTTVTVSAPAGAATPFWYGYSGATATFSLTAGQTYLVRTLATYEIDGALVTSTTPISLVVGGRGWGSGAGDDGADAVVPMIYAGTQYAVSNYPAPNLQDVRIVADTDGTTIAINGSTVSTLASGGVYKFTPTALTFIEASAPVVVFQNAGQDGAENDLGFIPPISFAPITASTIAFNVLTGSSGTGFVLVPTSAKSSLRYDGATVTPSSDVIVPNHAEWSGLKFAVTAGNHTVSLSADFQFGLVTGSGGTGLFGYQSPYRRPGCPDGNVDADEGCDDGNIYDGDGCSAVCEVEDGYTCSGTTSECSCVADSACAASTYCSMATTPSTCAAQLANGSAIPTDHGVCGGADGSTGSATRVCASGSCNVTTNTCGGIAGASCSAPSECANNICSGGYCGYDNGEGPCTTGDAGTVCRSGACSPSGYCVPAASGACATDSDCAASQFCFASSFSCNDDLASGEAIPNDGLHDGTCTTDNAMQVCVSGLCNTTTSTCAAANSTSCTTSSACVSNICGSNEQCGIADTDSGCTPATASALCQSGVCSPTSGVCLPPGGSCWLDTDCDNETTYCDRGTYTCVAKLGSGTSLPNDGLHDGVCSSATASAVCVSAACNATTQTCADSNGTACTQASTCVANVCGSNSKCGLDDGEAGCTVASEGLCQSGTCSANGAHCIPSTSGSCWLDADCTSDAFCAQAQFTCTTKLTLGTTLPVDGLHDTCDGANAACASGKCNVTANTCATDNGDACDDGSQCVANLCGDNGLCGLADGQAGCDEDDAIVVCQSAGCSPTGLCVPPSGCWVDEDCLTAQYCDRDARTCAADVAFGAALPSDGLHDGTCSASVAAIVCQSQLCNAVTNTCALANGATCALASQCVVDVCGSDGACGRADGELGCTQETATTVCQSSVCSAGGACIPESGCYVDADCASTLYCDRQSLSCVADLPVNAPIPSDGLHVGVCTSDVAAAVCSSGACSTTTNACANVNGATCAAATDCVAGACGANGVCGLANGESGCTTETATSVCQSGVCSVAGACMPIDGCFADGDCASSQWCNRATLTCALKLQAGVAIANDGAHLGECTEAVAAAVCASGLCNTTTDTCAAANQSACSDASECAVNICESGSCGASGNAGCTSDNQCQSGQCLSGLCSTPTAYSAGHGLFSCSATGRDGAAFELSCLMLALVGLLRRKAKALVALVVVLLAYGGAAQAAGFALERYTPAVAGSAWLSAESLTYRHADSLAGSLALRLDQSYAHDPLIVRTSDDVVSHVVANQMTTTLGASFVPLHALRIGVLLPVQTWANGTTATDASHRNAAPSNATALGDLQLVATYRFYGDADRPLRLGATARLSVPTGNRSAYAGDQHVSGGGAFIAAGDSGIIAWSASIGGRWREDTSTTYAGVHVGPEAYLLPAVGVMLFQRTLLVGIEVPIVSTLSAPHPFTSSALYIEPALGAHWQFARNFHLHAAAGAGMTDALGSPSVRGVLAVDWVH